MHQILYSSHNNCNSQCYKKFSQRLNIRNMPSQNICKILRIDAYIADERNGRWIYHTKPSFIALEPRIRLPDIFHSVIFREADSMAQHSLRTEGFTSYGKGKCGGQYSTFIILCSTVMPTRAKLCSLTVIVIIWHDYTNCNVAVMSV